MDEETFDYIVVGAGSAGCAVAARLSEDPKIRVLLLEAGADDPWIWLKIPLGVGKVLLGDRALWRYQTEPEPMLDDRRIFWPRGRVFGGSSGVNGAIWVRGEPREYDAWSQAGATGWSYAEILPVLRRMESYAGGDVNERGRDGPVRITEYGPRDALTRAFLAACAQAGIPETPDYNGTRFEGAGVLQLNTRRGLRHGGREAYLRPAMRHANLEVRANALVRRIRLDGMRATGVVYRWRGEERTARCGREIVVCAGAIGSPHLLELSGIGAPDHLAKAGIPVSHRLDGVGENLRDHLHTRISFASRNVQTLNETLANPVRMALMGALYFVRRDGPMSTVTATAHALARSSSELDRPDVKIQLHTLSAENPRHPTKLALDPFPGFGIGTFMLRPESRGSIHAIAPDPDVPPAIRANYLADPRDRSTCVGALKLARLVAAQAALRDFIVRETRPGPDFVTDAGLLAFAREFGTTSYHPVGTCRMGNDDGAVVDPRLRVRGLSGLRVADASVMPTMVSPNTNAPSFLIGEMVADFLRAECQ
ncbi:MAG: GMC family oxidoreductase N-terminal domain-containing protein [Proteobacteria bacterium]|nr:GMC family oxidoreductase N-terminal domain-containing protein [Pseudomonadota bacterium]